MTAEYDKVTGKLSLLKYDSDGNGKVDTWSYMDGPRVVRIEIDKNEDGKIDYWNVISPQSDNDQRLIDDDKVWVTLWWPAHRPQQSYEFVGFQNGRPTYAWANWSRGIQQTHAGDLKMVTEWWKLGFIVRNPYVSAASLNAASSDNTIKYISVERS